MPQAFTLSFPEPDVAVLTFDLPGKGANILSSHILTELAGHLDQLQPRQDLHGLVIQSGKPGTFIAGADLREFVVSLGAPKSEVVALCRRGQELFRRLSQMPFVTVAAIDGICVGGGAELASWCDRRIVTNNPKTEIGFPEVKLGLYPGWGGTVRAPRIVGVANAVEMITSGESVDAKAACLMGLASDCVPASDLLPAAIRLVRAEQQTGEYRRDRERWTQPIVMNPTELGFLGATASALIQRETKGQYPAPPAALELMLETSQLPEAEALQREAEGMAQLFGSPVNAALINVFFLTDRNKRDTGLAHKDVAAAEIKSVGVEGAGIMGSGIASAALKAGLPVTLYDLSPEALAKGSRSAIEDAAYNKRTRGLDSERALKLASVFSISHHEADLADCDLVIEAIVENPQVKKELFARLEPQMRPEAILASNTSTIPITRLAEGLSRPERFAGLHYFNPVRRMKLVEVIRGAKTSDETVATLVAYSKRIGKMPIVVNDGPGFLVNRLLFPYMNEAIELLHDGASIHEIDRAATAFGMPLGPIALYDMVGLDTAMYAGRVMYESSKDAELPSPIVPAIVKTGRMGNKSGRGFFSYQNKKGKAEDDPEVEAIIERYRRGHRKFTREELTQRLFMPMLLEATRVLEHGIVRDVRDVDLGLIFGLGFPPWRGGLLFWADTLGAAKIVEGLKPLAAEYPRFKPTAMLEEMAASGRKFYPQGGAA